jgi:purine-binding chemotaxis protein CheW
MTSCAPVVGLSSPKDWKLGYLHDGARLATGLHPPGAGAGLAARHEACGRMGAVERNELKAKAVRPSEARAGPAERFLVVFLLDDRRYALALDRVQRCLRVVAVTPLPEAPAIVLGIIDLGGVVIPVIDTRSRFHHPPREIHLSDHLLIATTGKRTVALLVDETKGVIEASPENHAPAEGILPRLEFVEGAVKLADGLILIHDLARLLSLDEETAIDRALAREEEAGR